MRAPLLTWLTWPMIVRIKCNSTWPHRKSPSENTAWGKTPQMTTWLGPMIPGCKNETNLMQKKNSYGLNSVSLKIRCNVNLNTSEHDLIWKQDHWQMLLVKDHHICGPLIQYDSCPYKKTDRCPGRKTPEDGEWDWSNASYQRNFRESMALSTPWFQTSSLYNYEKISFCCFMPPVCGT